MRQYSIAEARDRLPGIVHEAEEQGHIEITRRGRPVAVVVSIAEYRRLTQPRVGLITAFREWRESLGDDFVGVEAEYFEQLRDRTPPREVAL